MGGLNSHLLCLSCIGNVVARFSVTACSIFIFYKEVTQGTLNHCSRSRHLAHGCPTAPSSLPIARAAHAFVSEHLERNLLRFRGRGGPGSVLPLSWPEEYRSCRLRPKAAVRVIPDRPHPPKMRVPLVLMLYDVWGTLSLDAMAVGDHGEL